MGTRIPKNIREAIHKRAKARTQKWPHEIGNYTGIKTVESPYDRWKKSNSEGFTKSRAKQKIRDKKQYELDKDNEVRGRHRFFIQLKARARKANLPFDLEESDLIIPDVCPVLGIPLKGWLQNTKAEANSPSIDRIVSAKGDVKGNVQIISWRANKLRADASVQELECVLAYAKNLENFKGLG